MTKREPHGEPPNPFETLSGMRVPPAPVPPPGGYRPVPPPWAGPPQSRKSPVAWILVALLVVLILGCVGALAVGERQPPRQTPGSAPVAQGPDSPLGYRVGQSFQAGDFRYTVHAVETGIEKVGGEFYKEDAQGLFTRLDVTVENVGREPKFFDADWYLKLADTDGRQFSADTAANIAGNEGEDGWLTEINPGNSMRASIYFDLPKGVTAQTAQVSKGMLSFSADVIVSLS